ncbi:MAG: hypothetical protein KKF62_02370 [Bacteroidetes bacterium]|nr:hypothetical protein [Bacteroidota bacterium]MBU1115235.1 hypothetical protein [Bacteroidota bacterium]MBU1797253.1 hypothetical protein [Bacteroidota bacterium]
MNKNDLEKILTEFEPPNIKFEHNKNKLRRALLNSDLYGKQSWLRNLSPREISIASAFSIFIFVLISYYIFNQNNSNLDNILSKTKENYAGFLTSNKTNYFDSDLKIYGTENEEFDLKVEKWVNLKENKYCIVLKDNYSNEILDKIIIRDKKIYRMKNPKLQALNTVNSHQMIIFEIADELLNSTEFNADSISVSIDSKMKDKINMFSKTGLLVYNSGLSPFNETYINRPEINSMKISNRLNLDEYLMDNPLDLLKELASKSKITVSENYFDELLGKKVFIVQIEESILDTLEQGLTLKIDDSLSRFDSLLTNELKESHRRYVYYSMNLSDTLVSIDSTKASVPKSVKKILIDPETGSIEGVDYIYQNIRKNIKLSSSRFTNHLLVTKEDSKFDPIIDDLEYFGNTNKIKNTFIKKFSKDLHENMTK